MAEEVEQPPRMAKPAFPEDKEKLKDNSDAPTVPMAPGMGGYSDVEKDSSQHRNWFRCRVNLEFEVSGSPRPPNYPRISAKMLAHKGSMKGHLGGGP